ncbi:type IV secretion system DNA-binding domain-containing protein (plasmid) [Halopseudomonas sp. SMJS2]|uniref:type IV secretion system DNA-binding domain-containing protein n=1 Tax=Halopseudomonas sp. SMJS2 TaxID=3041098 RepID=UPI002452DE00|nr:type IV secretion system DNA-binding domain-containing protein [Halopseudomonas sp. SMJS2]WGK63363.1 type IV secretion system DNA-binding domain-containing protein [Halopseudomonas sp. SMJS2]
MTFSFTHADPIEIGVDSRGGPVQWAYPQVNNFNIMFMGASGVGKTHTIQHMLARVFARQTTFHVIDIKGDFGYTNFERAGLANYVSPDDFNDIRFNYFDGASINPLQVPRTPEGGGVLMTIESMKVLVKTFSPNVGVKQLTYLTEILKIVYTNKGILHDDMESWGRPNPTLNDLLEQIDLIFNAVTSGLPSESVADIMNDIGKTKRKASKEVANMRAIEEEEVVIADKVNELASGLIDSITAIIKKQINLEAVSKTGVGNGDVWEYWSKESLYGLRSVIQGMVDSRLFTGNPSRTMSSKINRYDLTDISPQHQQVIMRIIANRVLAMGIMETRRNDSFNPTSPTHVLVADEGKHVKEISQSPLSPFNRIGTEGRGYGVGIWAGVQSPDQVTQDLLKNFATYFVLATPEAAAGDVSRMFGIKPSYLKQLVPKDNILFSAGSNYSLVRHFRD